MDNAQFNNRRGPLRHRPSSNSSSAPYEPLRRSTDAKVNGLKDRRHLTGKTTAERSNVHFKEEAPPKQQDRSHAKQRVPIATSESSDRMNVAGSNEVDGDTTGATKRMGQTRASSSRNEKKPSGPVVKNPVKALIGLLLPDATSSRPRRQAPSSPSQTRQQSRERRQLSPPPKSSNSAGDQTAPNHNDKVRSHLQRLHPRSAMALNRGADSESAASASVPRKAAKHGARHHPAEDSTAADPTENKPATNGEKLHKMKRGLVAPIDKMAALTRALAVAKSVPPPSISAFFPLPTALESTLAGASDDTVAVNAAVAVATSQPSPPVAQQVDQPSENPRNTSNRNRQERDHKDAADSSVKLEKTNCGEVQRRRIVPPRKRPASSIKPEEDQDAAGATHRAKVPKTKRRDFATAPTSKAAPTTPFKTSTPSKKPSRKHVEAGDALIPAKSLPHIYHLSLMGSLPTHALVMPSKDARAAMRRRNVEDMDKSRELLQSCVRDLSDQTWAEVAPTGTCLSL